MPHVPRRSVLSAGALSLAGGAALTACGEDPSRARDQDSGGDGFPVTVEHAFGSTTLEREPVRIVCAGVSEHDVLLALGIVPIATTDWYGEQPYAVWPWASDLLGGAEPTMLATSDPLDLEGIAALEPDLVLALNAGLDEQEYARLTEIAPTVAHSGRYGDFFEPWPVMTTSIGRAVGRADDAEALVSALRQRFADTAAEHPEFAGKDVVFLQNAIYDGQAIAYPDGLSTEFLTDLGFTIPAVIAEYADGAQAYVPLENLTDLDDADVLLWATESEDDITNLEADPIVASLAASQEGRSVYTDFVLAGAIYFSTVLSLPYVLDHLVPALAGTVAGRGPARTERR